MKRMANEQLPEVSQDARVEKVNDHAERMNLTARQVGRAVTRSRPGTVKAPGAVLSSESSRALQEELAGIREAERQGVIGANNYYIGIGQLDPRD